LSHPVKLTRLAEADIAQAFDWYEGKKEHLGFEFIEQVEQAIRRISEHPLSHRKVIDNARRCNVERFPYVMWYRVEPDNSIVIACLHHKRNPKLASARAKRGPRL
jgi:toxin ParE1/3/4